jgi:hypothetical protein
MEAGREKRREMQRDGRCGKRGNGKGYSEEVS